MTKTKISFDVTIPEGYEWAGEVRCPKKDELYLSGYVSAGDVGEVQRASYNFANGMFPILRKIEVWVPLTLDKAIELFKARKPVTYRRKSQLASSEIQTKTISGIYRSASDMDCVCFPTAVDTIGLKHTMTFIEILQEPE
jgi:hypothetical protein